MERKKREGTNKQTKERTLKYFYDDNAKCNYLFTAVDACSYVFQYRVTFFAVTS